LTSIGTLIRAAVVDRVADEQEEFLARVEIASYARAIGTRRG